jgi:two-component system, OmpR family, sensor kinase
VFENTDSGGGTVNVSKSKQSVTAPLGAPEDQVSELFQLRQLVDDLRQAVRARDDFIAIAAHELRNPMTPIVGVAELALISARKAEGGCPPRVILLLERLQRLVQDYVGRASKLLDVSRLEAGNFQLEPAATNLSPLVLSVVHRYESEAAHQHCRLEHAIEADVSGLFDPLAVEQVIDNLVSNALKFGAGKPVTVRLRSEGRAACLEVQDAGIGMSSDQRDRIFGRFEQIVAHHHGGGFGLGLWIANRLVGAMDGQITVSSRPGQGINLYCDVASGASRQRPGCS